jgi:hypothetical protein
MSSQITTAFVKQFTANVVHLAQQKGSVLRPNVRVETVHGTQAYFDQIGVTAAAQKQGRHSDTPITDTPHARRQVSLTDYEVADLIDKQDLVRTLNDPANEYVQSFMYALGRSIDDVLLAAATGTSYTGVAGGTSTSLGNTHRVAAVSSSTLSNLNVQALRKAKYLMDKSLVDKSIPRYIAVNAYAMDGLLQQTEVTSHDYNSVKALVQGEIDTFMGFKFISTERLGSAPSTFTYDTSTGLYNSGGITTNSTSSSTYSIVCWAQDGLLLGIGAEPQGRISERDDKSYAMQAYASMSIGATRMEEAKVVEILAYQP